MSMSLELSDALEQLSGFFSPYETEELVLPPAHARQMREFLRVAYLRARALENLASREEWNALAKQEREERRRHARLVTAALQEPATNLALFPVIPRPITEGPCP